MDIKNRLTPCVLACLLFFLVGCTGNTAKEAAQEITKTETSFPAGNAETNSQEDTAEEPKSTAVHEKATITADESQSTAESQTVATVQTKPAEEKSADNPVTEKPKTETPQQTTTQAEPEKQPEQPKEQTTAEKKSEEKPAEPPKQVFDVSPYVRYAKEYAVSIGLSLDSTATECWDNPISANPNRSGIKSDIESRLNRYKNSEGFTAVWIWAEKASDTEYNIYIGYC
jgi:type IV secretory pathway VirB10-like protein